MARDRSALPHQREHLFLHYTGMETDIIFNRGIDLPGFASYPLLRTETGRMLLREYSKTLIELARGRGLGIMLDSVTWVANRDRGAALGYDAAQLRELNRAAIAFIRDIREEHEDVPIVLSAQMGPRGDGYVTGQRMSVDEAETYHAEQMEVLAQTDADLVSAFTIAYPEEAAGIVRAGQRVGMPVAVAFTVETDGLLPGGMPLKDAIAAVDDASDGSSAYFLVNCAHPDHFNHVLDDGAWISRVRGVVVNASRCSHAELDRSTELDDGDPEELGALVGGLRDRFPHFNIFGGCCGTDMRHLRSMANNLMP